MFRTDFATLGRKDKNGRNTVVPQRPELPNPHIIRPVANIKFKRVYTSHSGCHAVAISLDGQAFMFGRNDHHQLTFPLPLHLTTSQAEQTIISDSVGTLNASSSTTTTPPSAPLPFPLNALPDANVPLVLKRQRIVSAAVGRHHTVIITEQGQAWSCGWNNVGQCGHEQDQDEQGNVIAQENLSSFKREVGGGFQDVKIVAASAGIGFTIFLTDEGQLFAVGTGERGVLGNGKTGEYVAGNKANYVEQREPLLIEGAVKGKKIIQISSGQQHTIALDENGVCYAWGFGGFGRLGLGNPNDALSPQVIPTFSGGNVTKRCVRIACGSANTLFIDAQGMIHLCGRWKMSGDGSSGQPWMTPKPVQDIMGYQWDLISAGGVTLFASLYGEKEDDFTVAWGQNASYGELAFGPGATKSATVPRRIESLNGVTMLDVAAGQNTTFFIARPPPTSDEQARDDTLDEASTQVGETEEGEGEDEDETATTTMAPTIAETASTFKPVVGFDISGFGFSFSGATTATIPTSSNTQLSTSKHSAMARPIREARPKKVRSRTRQTAWYNLPRYPALSYTISDACQICGLEERLNEALECEMV
ncbi:hypothetical protein OIO90_000906 [Microbotryomycetes sp. JL221]|nr:hypothetical protein OIO90_000906 [Microbotryomycetes sp. JL221]